ncbi:hypothetical protein QQF64_020088 [Cirrhinus molitorella]|uniref:Fibronectin type-III domain-containing protein n=1 Tax=Cirrhinus molitorella TaxID=172907 RepID=A0ABR3LHB3_9TELE
MDTAALRTSTRAATAPKEDGKRPYIYHCRSPNMEIFTCWWRPIANQDNVTYTLLYTMGERAAQECPDYVSGGINSCSFDDKHTQVWEMYCMNVTAHTRTGPITSKKHCLDVVDIVEIDPPFNLTHIMLNESIGEVGRSVLVSWLYPIESLVREGLIILVYELRYRNLAHTDIWRVMERLREPHVELLDLPVGTYEFSVRCRSTSNKHWSAWSESIIVTISGRLLSDRMLALILVTSVAIMVFLIVSLGNVPQGKSRIKSFLLPPIPKPRIPGLEPALLKKGKLDEINCHFSSFHGYKSPQHSTETWYQLNVDTSRAATPSGVQSDGEQEDAPITASHRVSRSDRSQTDNSLFKPAAVLRLTAVAPPPTDCYMCVSGVTPAGALNLVSCPPHTPYLQITERTDEEDKSSQLAALLEKQMEGLLSATESDPSEGGMPLLPHSSDRSCRSI